MRKQKDRIVKPGDRFGRLLVLSEEPKSGVSYRWKVKCDCGVEKVIYQQQLTPSRDGKKRTTKSCGCFARESSSKRLLKHGACRGGKSTPTYSTWSSMIARCYNPNAAGYGTHGSRGISVCDAWRSSFSAFLDDVGERPSPLHSLDRINNDGNYCPENCRWATSSEQARNTRFSLKLMVNGSLLSLAEAAEMAGVGRTAFRRRLKTMSPDAAVRATKWARYRKVA